MKLKTYTLQDIVAQIKEIEGANIEFLKIPKGGVGDVLFLRKYSDIYPTPVPSGDVIALHKRLGEFSDLLIGGSIQFPANFDCGPNIDAGYALYKRNEEYEYSLVGTYDTVAEVYQAFSGDRGVFEYYIYNGDSNTGTWLTRFCTDTTTPK